MSPKAPFKTSSFLFANTAFENEDVILSPTRYIKLEEDGTNNTNNNIKKKKERKTINNNTRNNGVHNNKKKKKEEEDENSTFLPGNNSSKKIYDNNIEEVDENSYHDNNVDLLIAKLPPLTISDRTLHMFHLPMPDCSSKPFNIL